MEFYSNQTGTAEEVLSKYSNESRYQILLAQMQSGKSGTYLYLACMMIDQSIIDNVFVITGNWAINLKTQSLRDVKEAIDAFLFKKADSLTEDIQTKLEKNNKVIWGQDLDKADIIPPRSLIIWDESHSAQKNMNKPFNFFMKNGIHTSLVGNNKCLEEKNIFILSVSATPFSELAANIRTSRQEWDDIPTDLDFQLSEKMVTIMRPPPQYFGVHFYFENNCVFHSFPFDEENKDKLKDLLVTFKDKKGYFIIRSLGDGDLYEYSSILYDVCKELKIPVEYDHGDKSSELFQDDSYPYEGLKNEPSEFTIVHIKGKMRMGQVIPKKNILGVFETSRKPNIDVILQSLFGRMCGYSTSKDPYNSRLIKIFIPVSTIPLAKEYGKLMNEGKVNELVTKINRASCISGREKPPSTHTRGWYPIIPVYIPSHLFIDKGFHSKNIRLPGNLEKLFEIIKEYNLLYKQNSVQRKEIEDNFMMSGVGDGRNLVLKSYQDYHLPQLFMKGYKCKQNIKTNQDNFIRDYTPENPRQLSFFYVNEEGGHTISDEMKLLGYKQGDAFLIGYTRNQTDELKRKYDEPCPKIHEDCDFHPLSALLTPPQVPENHNGCQVIFAPIKTYNFIRAFKKWLNECILRSKKNKENGCWTSTINPLTNEVEYILLNKTNFMKKKNERYQLTNVVTQLEKKTKAKIDIDFADDIFTPDKRQIQVKQISWSF